ncbi:CHAT domain-containing protein [Streptomyces sp. NPDC048275]|uniref:CHAT domain-containing protein n=1 Tax=Streptomyces sp. NPDC048275 TaxID=3155629 RepID=UPI00340F523F
MRVNRDAVFGDEADAELRALLRIADTTTDMEARHAAGWLCAARAAGDSGDHGRVYGGMAGALLFPVWVVDPRLVPPEFAVGYAGIDPAARPNPGHGDSPADWAGECVAFLIAAEGQQHSPPPDASTDVRRGYETAAQYAAMTPSRDKLLASAIGYGTLSVLATAEDDPLYADRSEGLSVAMTLAGMTWPFGDLGADRVRFARRALKGIPSDSPDRLAALSNLGIQLLERYRQGYDPEDLHDAVGIARDVLAQMPAESPDLAYYLSALGNALILLLDQEGDFERHDEVVDLFRQVVPGVPQEAAAARLNLGIALLLRGQRTRRADDLDEAVHALTEALPASRDAKQTAAIRRALGNAQRARFTLFGGDPTELDTAIRHLSDPTAGPKETTPDSAVDLETAAIARYARYQHHPEGSTADLAEALRLLREAVAHLPTAHPVRPEALHHLGQVLKNSYEQGGSPEEVSEAVRAQREAVALTPEGHKMFETRMLDLGMALSLRHLLTDDGEDLREAQECWRRAVPSPGLDRAPHATLLDKVGIIRSLAIARVPELVAQLDETVKLFRDALALTPEGDPLMPHRHLGLAAALLTRFAHTQRRGDAREARKLADMVIAALPPNSPDLPNALAVAAGSRLPSSRNHVRDEAVTLARQLIEITPPNHPRRALRLANLGHALVVRRAGRLRADLVKAAEAYQEGALQQHCAPSQRLDAARFWGNLQAELGDWAGALDGYAVAVDLLNSVAPRHLARDDQELLLSRAVGLGAAAAACAVRCGLPGLAVGLLEQARGVLLSHAFDADSDLTRLREAAPDLANRFEELRDALDTATDSQDQGFLEEEIPGAAHGPDAGADLRQRLAAEWRELTGRIRAEHPELGLLRSVREWDERELRATAAAGPVVLVNVSPYGSDALVVTQRSIDAVPLPGLDPATTSARRQALQDALSRIETPRTSRTESLRAQQVVRDTLTWLWQAVTGPVLDHLGIPAAPAGPLPRVWWAPGGVLGTLPLHAATPQGGAPGALDRVVSSYTPTLRALHHARQRAARPAGTDALVVAVGEASGLAPLPAARREAEHLARLLPSAQVLTGASATHSAVVSALPRYAYAHFACHALGELERPSASRLVLHDHAEHPLTVRDLARLRLPSVQLAYLSACDTLRTSPELADEAVHIVSALQIAGFPHVVGSLWHVDDTIGAGVAQDVYEALVTGDNALDVNRTAEALHSTVCALRDTYPQTPSLWACQVHAGP